MTTPVDAATVKGWLSEPGEIAFLDVREAGQFGEGHAFFAVPAPYSRFELALPQLVPNTAVRMVLCDAGDGVAERAAARAEALGYASVHVLAGGVDGWGRAGYTLYAGVNLPSKTFGELIEHARHTPRLGAKAVAAMQAAGMNMVILDGRPFTEYSKMSIPGGVCCPNGELALRVRDLVPDPATTIVVNCAGRTRSIIGVQTLIELGLPNPMYALENGTQGWFLAGLELERGAGRGYPGQTGSVSTDAARALAARHGVRFVAAAEAGGWRGDRARTTYLLDVRTAEEFAQRSVAGFVHAPGGQLIQATDQWVGVKGARLVLLDADGVRAPVVAAWLRQLGHEACVLEGGLDAAAKLSWTRTISAYAPAALREVEGRDIASDVKAGRVNLIDLRPSMSYRAGHASHGRWSIRSRIVAMIRERAQPIVLVADEPVVAALAAIDLGAAGVGDVRFLSGGHAAWLAAGLPVEATAPLPADADCIDYLFFVHDRHDGNAAAAQRYLDWEIGLVAQLDAQERGVFRITPTSP